MREREPFTVVICTRGRAAQLARTLDALRAGSDSEFPIVVVDQSDAPDAALARRAEGDAALTIVQDARRGLSRARNVGIQQARTEWVAFVDDDCLVEADWAERLGEVIATHPEVALVSGDTREGDLPLPDYVPASSLRAEREQLIRGRRVHPGIVAFGVCFAVRRSVAERLGGWDERLGPGVPDFPAADDMDFNYRLLRSGAAALRTPAVRALHDQWREAGDLPTLFRGYLRAWSGFAMKQVRLGDPRGGLWLWTIGLVDLLDMVASAVRHRSRLRARIAGAKAVGLAEGTIMGLRRRW